jgi:hypothetical protein
VLGTALSDPWGTRGSALWGFAREFVVRGASACGGLPVAATSAEPASADAADAGRECELGAAEAGRELGRECEWALACELGRECELAALRLVVAAASLAEA